MFNTIEMANSACNTYMYVSTTGLRIFSSPLTFDMLLLTDEKCVKSEGNKSIAN